MGRDAGRYHADGSTALTDPENSVYIGYNSKGKDNNDNNSIVIGYNAVGIGANTIVLGNDSIVTTALKGNVGIGTTNPEAKLDVSTSSWGAEAEVLRFSNPVASTYYHSIVSKASTGDGSSTYIAFDLNDGNSASNTKVMTLRGDGNVGIGTTSPSNRLEIKSPQWGAFPLVVKDGPGNDMFKIGETADSGDTTLSLYDTGVNLDIFLNTNGNSYFNGGNVGINETDPIYGFDANCTGRVTGNFYANSSTFYAAGAVELDYNTAKKFETTSAGINIIGAAYANTDDKLFDEGDEDWQTSTATNPTWNMATSRNFEWTMASSGTLTISNGANGNSGVLILRANGAYTATLPASSTPASLVVTADNNVLAVYTKLNNGNYIWSSHTFLDPV